MYIYKHLQFAFQLLPAQVTQCTDTEQTWWW